MFQTANPARFGRSSLGIQSPLAEEPTRVGKLIDLSPTESTPPQTACLAPLTTSNLASHDNTLTSNQEILASPDDYTEFTASSEWDSSTEQQSLYSNLTDPSQSGSTEVNDLAQKLRAQLKAREKQSQNHYINGDQLDSQPDTMALAQGVKSSIDMKETRQKLESILKGGDRTKDKCSPKSSPNSTLKSNAEPIVVSNLIDLPMQRERHVGRLSTGKNTKILIIFNLYFRYKICMDCNNMLQHFAGNFFFANIYIVICSGLLPFSRKHFLKIFLNKNSE